MYILVMGNVIPPPVRSSAIRLGSLDERATIRPFRMPTGGCPAATQGSDDMRVGVSNDGRSDATESSSRGAAFRIQV
jgi:hypothetical protein